MFKVVAVCAAVVFAAGCSSSADKISAAYVSPLQYHSYSCQQLAEEAQRISSRVSQVSGVQDKKASDDAVATGVALVLFWPAAFLVSGNDQTTAELARLKGEFEAVEKASVQKTCGHQFQKRAEPDAAASRKRKASEQG